MMSRRTKVASHEQPIASAVKRAYWNEQFASWQKPATDAEEDRIERAARMIRAAIDRSRTLAAYDLEVIAQGSYRNNTNVRLDSDMDICVCHQAQLRFHIQAGAGVTPQELHISPLPEGTVETTFHMLKNDLYAALGEIDHVNWGDKALTIRGLEGSRVVADVVPALRYVLARSGATLLGGARVDRGTCIRADTGAWIVNFPEQHYERGTEKNIRTGRRYKKTVRILKRLHDEIQFIGSAPSFLIESLVYNCPDHIFAAADWYDTVNATLVHIRNMTADDAQAATLLEANEIKALFDAGQKWTRLDAWFFALAGLEKIS